MFGLSLIDWCFDGWTEVRWKALDDGSDWWTVTFERTPALSP